MSRYIPLLSNSPLQKLKISPHEKGKVFFKDFEAKQLFTKE
jgi:hypothetical protein